MTAARYFAARMSDAGGVDVRGSLAGGFGSLGISLVPIRSMVVWLVSALTLVVTFLLLVGRLALTGALP
jgi:hypothetical protein